MMYAEIFAGIGKKQYLCSAIDTKGIGHISGAVY